MGMMDVLRGLNRRARERRHKKQDFIRTERESQTVRVVPDRADDESKADDVDEGDGEIDGSDFAADIG